MSLSITSSTHSSQQEAPKSCVKRDRARRQESKKLRENILNNLPVLTNREVRRFRIPYHEALCLELDEDGFCEASKFFRLLIQYQEDMRNEAGPENIIWFYPQLVNEKDKLDMLRKGLQEAEEGKLVGKFKVECEKFLKIAIYFSNLPVGWWWLARQLFLQATDCAEHYKDDGGRLEAIVRYIFGRFYLYQLDEVEEAIEQLKTCREKAVGRSRWSAESELGLPQKSVYVECCILLYRALLVVAKQIMDEDPVKAARLCQIAQNRAKDAQDDLGMSECLLQLGMCELRNGNANTALIKFNKVLAMSLTAQSPERICEARIQIALAQSRLGNMVEANSHLESLLEYALTNRLAFYYGQAHRFLGELYLNEGQARLATPLLIRAVEIFYALYDSENAEQVKNLAAISTAQELLPKYVELILKCENHPQKQENIIKLVKWKDSRELFFTASANDDEYSSYSLSEHLGNFNMQDIFLENGDFNKTGPDSPNTSALFEYSLSYYNEDSEQSVIKKVVIDKEVEEEHEDEDFYNHIHFDFSPETFPATSNDMIDYLSRNTENKLNK